LLIAQPFSKFIYLVWLIGIVFSDCKVIEEIFTPDI